MEHVVLPLASRGSRIINSIIDSIVIFILWIIILIGITVGLVLLGFDPVIIDPQTKENFTVIAILPFIPAFFLYYIVMESKYQRTIGKYLTKTKVVTKAGAKPAISKIVLRTLCRLIPFEGYSFLVASNGIHDSLSGTSVVKWYA